MTKQLSETHATNRGSVMVYGAPKTGKTQLVGELAEHFNLIWVDLENGHDTLYKLPIEWQERITLIELPDTRDFPVAIETCLKLIKGGAVSICDEHGKVKCMLCKKNDAAFTTVDVNKLPKDSIIVFDSVTQLNSSAIAHITKDKPVDYKLDWDDWHHLGVLMEVFYSHIQQGRFNVVCISHEIEAETEGSKRTLVPVAGTRNFSRNVAKFFGHVVYCERKLKKHAFLSMTTDAPNVLCGSRTDVDISKADKPSLLPIYKPELFKTSKVIVPEPVPIATPTKKVELAESSIPKEAITHSSVKGGTAAQSVLAKLKARHK